MSEKRPSVVGSRVKFRDDHDTYPGMIGTVTEWFPGWLAGEPMVGITLDPVLARAEEIEPESYGDLLAKGYAERMSDEGPQCGKGAT